MYRSKKEALLHLYGRNRIRNLLEFGGLAGWRIVEWGGVEHFICGKVIVGREGRSNVGYVLEELNGFLFVKIFGDDFIIEFRRPAFDENTGLFCLPVGSTCNRYSLLQVDPIRIKINVISGHCSIIISAMTIGN